MGTDNGNIDHTGVPDFESCCDDMIIGYACECEQCGAEIIIYATHEVPLCADCAAKSCPIVRKRLKDE